MNQGKQPPSLFRRQPVPEADAQPSHALDTTNACGQFGTQQTGISRLVRDTTDGGQPQIDGRGRVMGLLEVDAIAEDDGAVECEARLRAVPGDELANRVLAGPLAARGRQAIQHGRLGLFQVGKGQHSLRRLLLA